MLKTKNKIRKALAIFLLAVFLFSPVSFSFKKLETKKVLAQDLEVIFPDDQSQITRLEAGRHLWRKDDNIEINGTVMVEYGAMLEIEAGTTIKFRREEGEIAPMIYVAEGGMILAQGTESEKIIFTSDQENSHFSIIFDGDNDRGNAYSGFLRYVEISNGGGEYQYEGQVQAMNPFLKIN